MKSLVCAFGAMLAVATAARAEGESVAPRSVFCIAVRTVPLLDQNNYVMGGMGPIYMTPNFKTALSDEDLVAQWRGFISQRHPAACVHGALVRRGTVNTTSLRSKSPRLTATSNVHNPPSDT